MGNALHCQSAITMRTREVVDDRHVGILLIVNEVSLVFPFVKSGANFNERHCIYAFSLGTPLTRIRGALKFDVGKTKIWVRKQGVAGTGERSIPSIE